MAKTASEKIRITLSSFDHRLLDDVVKKIVLVSKDSGAIVVGPIPLPTKIEKITLNRSTFVNKDAREQFEIRKHKRLIDITESTSHTLDSLKTLNVPSGVGVELKTIIVDNK